MKKEKNIKRILYIDFLRIIACFLVIVNHTNSVIFLHSTPSSCLWWLSVSTFFVSRIAVPIFLMVTGATLLNGNSNYKTTFKRVFRMITILLIFSFLYYSRKAIRSHSFSIKTFLMDIYNKPITNAYWYLYLYIGILLMIPFLQKFVRNLQKKDFMIFFIISFLVYGIWPIIIRFYPALAFNKNFQLPLFEINICYLLLGYYISNYSQKYKTSIFISSIIFIVCLLINVIMTYFEYLNNQESYTFFSNREFFFIAIPSICVFYLCRIINWGGQNYINTIGKCTLGIYLLSDYFIGVFNPIYQIMNKMMPVWLAMLFYQCMIFGTGLIITWLLKHIPVIKKLI